MTKTRQIIRLQGQRRSTHEQLRENLRGLLAKMQQQEQKLLAQFGVQSYQDIRDSTAQGVMEEVHKAYQLGGQWDNTLTRHLEEGIEVTVDFSDIEATKDELNNLFNVINRNIQALSGE